MKWPEISLHNATASREKAVQFATYVAIGNTREKMWQKRAAGEEPETNDDESIPGGEHSGPHSVLVGGNQTLFPFTVVQLLEEYIYLVAC